MINIGIIGYGYWGPNLVRNFAETPGAAVAAVADLDPAKLAMLTLTNDSNRRRRLSVFGYAEWCLGPPRSGERRFVVTERDEASGALFARHRYNTEHGEAGGLGAFPARQRRTRRPRRDTTRPQR